MDSHARAQRGSTLRWATLLLRLGATAADTTTTADDGYDDDNINVSSETVAGFSFFLSWACILLSSVGSYLLLKLLIQRLRKAALLECFWNVSGKNSGYSAPRAPLSERPPETRRQLTPSAHSATKVFDDQD